MIQVEIIDPFGTRLILDKKQLPLQSLIKTLINLDLCSRELEDVLLEELIFKFNGRRINSKLNFEMKSHIENKIITMYGDKYV